MINIQEKYSSRNLDPRWDNKKVSYDLEVIKRYYEFYYKQ